MTTPRNHSSESRGSPENNTPSASQHRIDPSSGEEVSSSGTDAGQKYLLLRGLVIPLPTDKDMVIGRDDASCDLVLVDERVSKRHAMVSYYNGRYFVKDLGSLNGTYVNGKPATQKTPLVSDDEIRVRPYKMLFAGHDHPQVVRSAQNVLISDASKHAGHFSGLLKVVPVTDLIQLLNSTQQSGILTLQDPSKNRAKLIFSLGEIVAATYSGKMSEDAVYAVLALKEGRFDFMPGSPPTPPSPIAKKTLTLLLEGCRLVDEGAPTPDHTLPADGMKTRQIPRLLS